MKKAIIIFVRKPEWGLVKTRLAVTVGNQKALDVYLALLSHTKKITQLLKADKFVFYANAIDGDDMWNEDGFTKRVQSDKDLGNKMKDAFAHLFDEGYEKVLIIGSDCFELTTPIINEAFHRLDEHDVVIGPANDGGYYLLGMKEMQPFVFDNKNWSTETVFDETLQSMNEANLSYNILETLTDVDEEKDLPEEWRLQQ